MMKRFFCASILFSLLFTGNLSAQMEVFVSSGTSAPGTSISIDVTTENFNALASAQYALVWDEDVLEFSETNFASSALSLNELNFNSPAGGVHTFSWSTDDFINGTSIPDGSLLYTIVFNVTGDPCDETDIEHDPDNSFTITEIININGQELNLSVTDGLFSIPGSGCNQTSEFSVDVEEITINQGGEGCVPIIVTGFDSIISIQFGMKWDPAVIMFDTIKNFGLPGLDGLTFNFTQSSNGVLGFLWTSTDFLEGESLSDGATLFEVCFKAVGSGGSMSNVEITTDVVGDIEFSNVNGVINNPDIEDGKVTISGGGANDVEINVGDQSGIPSGEEVCVDITVKNFTDIVSTQFRMVWNNDILEFDTIKNFALPGMNGLTFNLFDADDGELKLLWIHPDLNGSSTLDDDAVLFQINFIAKECPNGVATQTANVDIEESGDCITEVSGLNGVLQTTTSNGSVIVECGCSISVDVEQTNPICADDCNGSIDLTINGCQEPYTFSWNDGASTEDRSDLCAGTYSVTIMDANNIIVIPNPIVIADPDPISISAVDVSPDTGTGNGSIDITVQGGSGDYMYSWSNGAGQNEDPNNLSTNDYAVTITDSNNCTFISDPISVPFEDPGSLNVTAMISNYNGADISCPGECDGEINLIVTNATEPVNYSWSHTTENTSMVMNLCAGQYSVTATDGAGKSYEETFTLTDPSVISIEFEIDCADVNQSNGSIRAIPTGGVGNYSYVWSDSTSSTQAKLENVSKGIYTVMVTDANQCTAMSEGFVCGGDSGGCYNGRLVITPNGDGKNEQFFIECVFDKENTLEIYNRFGQMVFEMDNYDNSWTGTDISGTALANDTYLWVLIVEEGDETQSIYKGAVTVIRSFN